jgi:lactate dehydrogenase-like 2-hydroxyacid dehydrogenase
MDNKNIYFLDVPKSKRSLVSDSFPGAKIFDHVLEKPDFGPEVQILCVSYRQKIGRELIESCENLKLIVTRSAGYDNIDIKAAEDRGVIVSNVSDYGPHVIAEFVFALLLSGLRHIREADERVENHKKYFSRGLKGVTLKSKTIGIIGLGKIGAEVSKIASLGFSMRVLAYDPKPDVALSSKYNFKYSDLDSLCQESDIITLHCPLNSETKHLINKNSIAKMKKGVVLVNTSRGGLIKTADLIPALKSEYISSVFLDVLENEAEIRRHEELIDIPEVITTPHIAAYADDSKEKMYKIAIEHINSFLKGETLDDIINNRK